MAEQRGKRRPKRPATAPSDGLDDGELPPLLRAVPSLLQLPVEMLPEALPPPAVRVELEEIDHEDEAAPADDGPHLIDSAPRWWSRAPEVKPNADAFDASHLECKRQGEEAYDERYKGRKTR